MAGTGLFLGVDGGQSSTKAAVGDADGRILARSVAGPCNHAPPGRGAARFRKVMAGLLRDVTAAAGLAEGTRFDTACFAMSGGPDDKRDILAELAPAGAVEVTIDAVAALEGATAGGAGVVVVAGTGSIALARDNNGRMARRGGWGYLFGDEGGAFDIVRRALRAVLASDEGRAEPTGLKETLLEASGGGNVDQMLHRFYTPDWPRDRVAGLAPLVDRVAEQGDKQAERILQDAGTLLAKLGASAGRAVGWVETAHWSGGAFRSRTLRSAFEGAARSEGLRVEPPAHDPVVGALLLAYRARGLSVDLKEVG